MSELAPEQLVPPLAALSYAGFVAGAGALANCAALTALIRKSRCGLFLILIQLAITDIIILFGPGALELWSRNEQTWSFGTVGCMIYGGLDVFTSTASVYLTITAVLHTIATINLEVKAVNRRAKRNRGDDELRSSRHSLVANSDSSTPPRTMNVHYKTIDARVPVSLPSVFVWILATSLSVPVFVIANTIRKNNSEICVLLEYSNKVNMHTMLAIFNVYLPTAILCVASGVTIMKLRTKWSLAELDDLGPALKLSLWLIVTYTFLCLPRSVFTSYIIYSTSVPNDDSEAFTFSEDHVLSKFNFATTCIYLLASMLRPLLYIFLLPRLRCTITTSMHTNETEDV